MSEEKKRVFPNVIGIGTMKAGTTWMYDMLGSHEDVFMSSLKKEVHYFDNFYDKGLDWYAKFFPDRKTSKKFKIIGEFTPTYLNNEKVPARIKKDLKDVKFIVILRNPIEMVFSSYRYKKLKGKFDGTFKEMTEKNKAVVEMGYYGKHLENWLKYFPRKKFHIIIFEEMIKTPDKVLKDLAKFLDIDPKKFDYNMIGKKSNETFIPRFKPVYTMIERIGKKLREKDKNNIVNTVKRSGLLNIFKSEKKIVTTEEDRLEKETLRRIYSEDIRELEVILGRKLNIWRRKL